jgi:hypothetical protein
MKIKHVTSQHRNDFTALMECEYCGGTQNLPRGYDDAHYHDKVIPAMTCNHCGKDRSGAAPMYGNDGTAQAARELELSVMLTTMYADLPEQALKLAMNPALSELARVELLEELVGAALRNGAARLSEAGFAAEHAALVKGSEETYQNMRAMCRASSVPEILFADGDDVLTYRPESPVREACFMLRLGARHKRTEGDGMVSVAIHPLTPLHAALYDLYSRRKP